MKIKYFNKLKNTQEKIEFNQRFKFIYLILKGFSYFGHIVSIIIGYYFIYSILKNSIGHHLPDNLSGYVEAFSSIIFLFLFEMLKRFLFNQASFEMVRNKLNEWKRGTFALLLFTFIIVSTSFYFGINGANKFANTTEVTVEQTSNVINTQIDSLKNVFNPRIISIEKNIKERGERSEILKKNISVLYEQLNNSTGYQSNLIRNQIRESESKLSNYDNEIKLFTSQLDSLNNLLTIQTNSLLSNQNNRTQALLTENENSSNQFLLVVIFIEMIILIGIYFENRFNYLSYNEMKSFYTRSDNYKKWILYTKLLDVIYQKGKLIVGDKTVSKNKILELAKIQNIQISQKDVEDFYKVLQYLNIIVLKKPNWEITQDREEAIKEMTKYFNMEN